MGTSRTYRPHNNPVGIPGCWPRVVHSIGARWALVICNAHWRCPTYAQPAWPEYQHAAMRVPPRLGRGCPNHVGGTPATIPTGGNQGTPAARERLLHTTCAPLLLVLPPRGVPIPSWRSLVQWELGCSHCHGAVPDSARLRLPGGLPGV